MIFPCIQCSAARKRASAVFIECIRICWILLPGPLRSVLEGKSFFAGYLHRPSRWFPKPIKTAAHSLFESGRLSACQKSLFAPLPVQFFKLIKFEKLLD